MLFDWLSERLDKPFWWFQQENPFFDWGFQSSTFQKEAKIGNAPNPNWADPRPRSGIKRMMRWAWVFFLPNFSWWTLIVKGACFFSRRKKTTSACCTRLADTVSLRLLNRLYLKSLEALPHSISLEKSATARRRLVDRCVCVSQAWLVLRRLFPPVTWRNPAVPIGRYIRDGQNGRRKTTKILFFFSEWKITLKSHFFFLRNASLTRFRSWME